MTVIFVVSGTSQTSPADWNNSSNTIEGIGGAGGGCSGPFCRGGGGGEYRKISNFSVATPGTTAFNYVIGQGGAGGVSGVDGGNGVTGSNTTFNVTSLIAVGGTAGRTDNSGGPGGTGGTGAAGNANGGTGGNGPASGGGGGGGAGGSLGAGGAGGSSTGTSGAGGGGNGGGSAGGSPSGSTGGNGGDNQGGTGHGVGGNPPTAGTNGGGGGGANSVSGVAGAAGGAGTEWDSTHGSGGGGGGGAGFGAVGGVGGAGALYGGGGGGGGDATAEGNGGAGKNGIIVITYTPAGTAHVGAATFSGLGAFPTLSGFGLTPMQPDADLIDGTWTTDTGGTSLFAAIDEMSIDDADYIKSVASPINDICKISLGNPTVTPTQPFIVMYRYEKTGVEQIDLGVRLLQGATEIAAWSHSDIATSFVTAEQTLSGGQFSAISDFNDLFIEFTANMPVGLGLEGDFSGDLTLEGDFSGSLLLEGS